MHVRSTHERNRGRGRTHFHHGECFDDFSPLREFVDSERLNGLAALDNVVCDAEAVVNFHGSRLGSSTALSLMKLAVFFDDTNGDAILCKC